MTVSSPPSRPDPDGEETGSGSARSPPPPSNSETSNVNPTINSHIQSADNRNEAPGNDNKQTLETNITHTEVEKDNLETEAIGNTKMNLFNIKILKA